MVYDHIDDTDGICVDQGSISVAKPRKLSRKNIFKACVLAIPLSLSVFFMHLTSPPSLSQNFQNADVAVVFTGSDDRVEYGLQLLAEGKVDRLHVSGIFNENSAIEIVRQYGPAHEEALDDRLDDITFDRAATTVENVIATHALMRDWQGNSRSYAVITSCFHMARSHWLLKNLGQGLPQNVSMQALTVPSDTCSTYDTGSKQRWNEFAKILIHRFDVATGGLGVWSSPAQRLANEGLALDDVNKRFDGNTHRFHLEGLVDHLIR